MDEQKVREVALLLVKAIGGTRKNLMAANMALHAIATMKPNERAALSQERIRAELASIDQQLGIQPDPAVLHAIRVLESDKPFLEELHVFASQLRW